MYGYLCLRPKLEDAYRRFGDISLIYKMEIHKDFTEWAIARGVNLNGIAIHRFPGRGLGIVAEKELEVLMINLYVISLHLSFVS